MREATPSPNYRGMPAGNPFQPAPNQQIQPMPMRRPMVQPAPIKQTMMAQMLRNRGPSSY